MVITSGKRKSGSESIQTALYARSIDQRKPRRNSMQRARQQEKSSSAMQDLRTMTTAKHRTAMRVTKATATTLQ